MSETDENVQDHDSVIAAKDRKNFAHRAVDRIRRKNRQLMLSIRIQPRTTEDTHDIPWQQNNNSDIPRPSTVTDRSSTSMRPLFGSARRDTDSGRRSSATIRPRMSTTFEQGVNHVSGSVRNFKNTLKRQMSRLDDFGVISRPRGQSSPIPIPDTKADTAGRRKSDIACYRGSELYKTRSFLSFLRRRRSSEDHYDDFPPSESSSEETEDEGVYEPAEISLMPGTNQRMDSLTMVEPEVRRKSKAATSQQEYLESLSRTALQHPRVAENGSREENISSIRSPRQIQFASHADEDPFVDAKTAQDSKRGLVESTKYNDPTTIPIIMGKSMSKESRGGNDHDQIQEITNEIQDDYVNITDHTGAPKHASLSGDVDLPLRPKEGADSHVPMSTVRVVIDDSDSETEDFALPPSELDGSVNPTRLHDVDKISIQRPGATEAQGEGKIAATAVTRSRSFSPASVSPRTCTEESIGNPTHSVVAEFINGLDFVSKAHLGVTETYGFESHGSHQHPVAKITRRGVFFGSSHRGPRCPRTLDGSSSISPAEQHFQAVAADMTGQERQLLEYVCYTNPVTVANDSVLATDPDGTSSLSLPIWKYGPIQRDIVRESRTRKRTKKATKEPAEQEQAGKEAVEQEWCVKEMAEQEKVTMQVAEQASRQGQKSATEATATPPSKASTTFPTTPSRMSTPTFMEMEDQIIASGYYGLQFCKANGSTYWGAGEECNQDVLEHCLQNLRRREQQRQNEAAKLAFSSHSPDTQSAQFDHPLSITSYLDSRRPEAIVTYIDAKSAQMERGLVPPGMNPPSTHLQVSRSQDPQRRSDATLD